MSISHSLTRVVVAAAAACSLFAAAAPAQAAVIGSFDPAFGVDIPNLGFRGTFSLEVTPGCFTGQAHYASTGDSCGITVNTISIFFYNSNPLADPSITLSRTTLDSGFFLNGDDTQQTVNYVSGAYFDANNQILGFDTIDSYLFPVAVTDNNAAAPISYSGDMLLYFTSGYRPVQTAAVGDSTPGDAAFLVDCNTTDSSCSRRTGTDSQPATVTFNRAIPEPGTMPLALLGVIALIASRRRARAALPGRVLAR